MFRKSSIWLCLTLCTFPVWSQSFYRIGMLPQINFNTSLKSDWGLNSKIESRQIFRRGVFDDPEFSGYEYALTDVSLVLTHKFYSGSSAAAGYLMRISDDGLAHRFIQQYSFVNRYAGFRLGHRFVADQTLESGEDASFRLRYRIGIDLALNGQKVDPGEWYFKLTNEYLNVLEGGTYDLELRLGPTLGHAFTDKNKLEVGLDYRWDSLLSERRQHSLWLKFAWYLKYG
ncbi:MAG: DUF2490 domain-containing protein [Bacteroidota bacterium]